jgi:hypothetical protein
MKKGIAFLMLGVLCVSCFAQLKKNEDRQNITLCWYTSYDTTARYLIYFNRYNSTDTVWRYMGITKDKIFTVAKESFKGDIAFGVKAVYKDDTSSMHTSLDSTACKISNAACDTTCTSGPWYISWHLKKPSSISAK